MKNAQGEYRFDARRPPAGGVIKKICSMCRVSFTATRPHSVTCSTRCRMRLCRLARKLRSVATPARTVTLFEEIQHGKEKAPGARRSPRTPGGRKLAKRSHDQRTVASHVAAAAASVRRRASAMTLRKRG